MAPVPDRATFENAYAGQAPWDIDGPQPAFVAVAHHLRGSILDAGCGTGDNALFFADRGNRVTGIDFLAEPIRRAQQKAAERGLSVNFQVFDALALADLEEQFDNVIDSGLFHVFDDDNRRRYVASLGTAVRPGGKLMLLCFSDAEPGAFGPRRVSQAELRAAFAEGWTIDSIESARFGINPEMKDLPFSDGGPHAWFAVIRRAQ